MYNSVIVYVNKIYASSKKKKVVRLRKWPPTLRINCLRATDHVPTGSVTQRSNNERLLNIGLAPPVSSTKWNGAAAQCKEINPDYHNQHAQKPLGTVTNSAILQTLTTVNVPTGRAMQRSNKQNTFNVVITVSI